MPTHEMPSSSPSGAPTAADVSPRVVTTKHPKKGLFGNCGNCNIIQVSVFIAFYCDYVLNSLGVPILPTFLAKLNVSDKYIGILFASKPAVQIFANAAAGVMVDRGGAKPVLLSGLAVLAVSTAVFGIGLTFKLGANLTYNFLLVARCVQGLSSAFIMSAGMSWIARTHTSARRGTVMGMVLVGIGAGAVSGATFGGVLASMFGNSSPFFVVAFLLVVDTFLIMIEKTGEVQEPPAVDLEDMGNTPHTEEKASEWRQAWTLLHDPSILCINILVFSGNAGMTILQPTLPIYANKYLGFGQFGQGVTWGVMTFTYLLSRPLSGIVADKLAKWTVITIGVLSLGIGLMIVGSKPLLFVVVLGICCVGVGVAFITTPCMPLLADIVEAKGSQGYGLVYSMADISTSLGMIVGPLMGSLLSGWFTFRLTCHAAGAMMLLNLMASMHLKKMTKPGREK
mmetsp:Transcript_10338/g.15887  ORF Transcript_10338/g.15887 Transcript_10338/m.15887 type:complete len:453 (+) Transcript_10338:82-1440(+)